MQLIGRFEQISQELKNVQQAKELEKNELRAKIDILQQKAFEFETKNQLLKQEKSLLEAEKQQWSHDKESMLHKISEEIIKKSHEQQNKISQSQEQNIKKITLELFQNFENVTSKVNVSGRPQSASVPLT